MTTVSYAVVGALFAFLFAVIMVFKVMPQADHIVKKNYGPTEACCFTRCCFMVCLLPWYVFTIWMAIVVMFDEDHGVGVIEELCGDFACARGLAFGLETFDKETCQQVSCSTSEVEARQGSHPDGYGDIGLGSSLSFETESKVYTCQGNSCSSLSVSDGESCDCPSDDVFECIAACESAAADFSLSSTCVDDKCQSFSLEFDSDQEFGIFSCQTEASNTSYTCETLVSPYYYPNIFFAISMVILFVLPVMLVTYVTLRTQLKKVIKCDEMTLYIYSQEAGIQREARADNIATGGYTNAVEEKHKYRTCGLEDVLALTVGPALIVFFCWLIIISSGIFGVVFICMAFGFLFFQQLYTCQMFKKAQREKLEERVKENNNNAAYF